MRLIYIARKNLFAKPLQTALSTILLAFGVGMVSLMMLSEKQIKDQFERNIKDIDLVLGAKGSPLQLILANVYHIDAPTGNIDYQAAKDVVNNPRTHIESGIPLAYGDNYMSYRIVGTEYTYPEHYGAVLKEGELWSKTYDVVVGAEVAKKTGLDIGSTFYSSHGLTDTTDVHRDKVFTVVGIFDHTSSVIDNLLLTGIESVWGVHEGHENADKEITAMLLKKRTPMAVLTLPNYLKETNMQVALPSIEINRLNQQFGIGASALRAIAVLIMALSFASIFISVFENMHARRYELALMRTMGGSPSSLYKLLLLEGGLLSAGGVILGLLISRLGLFVLASAVENKLKYDLSDMGLLQDELYLALAATFVGLLAAALPAFKALRMDISKTLSND